MDKIKKYQLIIEKVLLSKIGFPSKDFPYIKETLLVDKDKRHFMLYLFGWDKEEYVHHPVFHLEITDKAKIYVHENRTDVLIDDLLVENKVAAADILDGMEETYPHSRVDSKAA